MRKVGPYQGCQPSFTVTRLRYILADQTAWTVQSAKEIGLSSNAHTYCG